MSRSQVAMGMGAMPTVLSLVILLLVFVISQSQIEASQEQKHTRKSIVFDLKTPKVFYCPQEKQSGDQLDKMIVKAQSLEKLCEFEGKQKPRGAPSDCYNDVDETEFACDEKRRFMIRLDLASEGFDSATRESIDDLDFILSGGGGGGSSSSKKKALPIEKKKNKQKQRHD